MQDEQKQLGKGMIIVAWLMLLGLLTWAFSGYLDNQQNPNRDLPTGEAAQGVIEVRLQRNRAGHYLADGFLNGVPVTFLLDTGATDVAVPADVADRVGLQRGARALSRTANGTITTWRTRIDTVRLGGIELQDVRASILPNMPGDQVLLGMSFLKRLELLQRGDQLRLRQ